MSTLSSLPVLALAVILQSTVLSRVPLLNGTLDLVLLVVLSWALNERANDEWIWALVGGALLGFVSAIPFWVPILSYLAAVSIAVYLKRRVWRIPVLALFVSILTGTLIVHAASLLALAVFRTPAPVFESLNLIVLPGLVLNLLAALPVNAVIGELAAWVTPEPPET